ncbi:Hypothetical protein PHPALM_36666 [Phytophthora palmivora]|uniref:Uncharacterized protein n=1 Tax=Phytophthora palmivora TaxID=4796 RepID=A0A2P4WZD6_9STRA|nr:Hypothetical protein PHPALM_36666 [Phytophthora palmivora]
MRVLRNRKIAGVLLHTVPELPTNGGAPTANVHRSYLDLQVVRDSFQDILSSLRGVETAINQESIFRQLQDDHEDLQHAHTASIHHLGDLHRHLDHLRSQAKPFAKFCQDLYDTLIDELENSNIQLVESRSAVKELEEKLDRVSKLRDDYSELQATSKSTILCLEDEIDTLKRQVQNLQAQLAALTSHPNLGSPPPPALARLLFNQDQELAAARQRDQTQDQSLLDVRQHLKDRDQELSTAQQRCQALERSEASLEAAALQRQRQIIAQDRRITRLQEGRDQFRTDCHEAQSERDQALAKANSTSERLDKARAELRARGNHVDSIRANILRLEQQVADLQTARSQVDHQFMSQKRELAALRVEHAALSAHYKDAYSRFWVAARSLNQDVALPTPASLTRPRSGSESSPTRSHMTRRLDLSPSNSPDDRPDPEDQDPEVPEPEFSDLPQESEIEQEGGSPEDDADNPEMLAALAKSRSDLRRSKPSDGDMGASGTAGHPIDLGGEGSDHIPSDDLPEQSPDIDPPVDNPDSIHDDGDLASGAGKSLPDIQQSSEAITLTPPCPKKYLEYEEKHLQALCESSHFLPISEDMCVADAALSAYHESRRQRRSRAGAAWKQFLFRHLIPALRQQYCDLDVLLDPFFLHFSKPRHPKIWYPDVSATSLEDALSVVDLAEPWLNLQHSGAMIF